MVSTVPHEPQVWPTAEENALGQYLYESLCATDPDPIDEGWAGLSELERDVYRHTAPDLSRKIESLREKRPYGQ